MPHRRRFRREILGGFTLISLLIFALSLVFLHNGRELEDIQRRSDLNAMLDRVIQGMRVELERNSSLVNSFAAFILSHPDLSTEEFNVYVQSILIRYPGLVNMAAAPDLVIRYIYPLEGNEEALGLDYRTRPEQMVAINYAIENRAQVFAGPLQLVQGGQAFIVQAPVIMPDTGQVWGVVSIPILTAKLYERAGLGSLIYDRDIAIRSVDWFGARDSVFFGNNAVFDDPRAIIKTIRVGDGAWEVAGRLGAVQAYSSERIHFIYAMALVAFVVNCAAFLTIELYRRKHLAYQSSLIRNESFMKRVEEVSEVGGWNISHSGQFVELSQWARVLLGIPESSDLPQLDDWTPPYDESSNQQLKKLFEYSFAHQQDMDTRIQLHRVDGSSIWLYLKADAGGEGEEFELTGAVQDVTSEEESRQRIEFQSNYDQLTGLPNRQLLDDRLEGAISRARRSGSKFAVCFLDVDNFKTINDTLGHEGGDKFLIEISRRIEARLRSTDTVARYSGDEFVLILNDVHTEGLLLKIIDDLQHILRAPYEIEGNSIYSGASIGIALFPLDSDEGHDLILKADQAMYVAKKSGKNDWAFYQAEMQAKADERSKLFNDLVAVIERQGLQVFFQPIIETATGKVAGCESLVRWQREDGSWVQPELFIDVAEERGLISQIDLFVLEQAIAGLRSVNRDIGENLFLSVNASPRLLSMRDATTAHWVQTMRECTDLFISVEITERVLVDMDGNADQLLRDLRGMGKGLSLDDFGTGYSGFTYISKFPLTAIKIDRSFVNKIEGEDRDRVMVESQLSMSKKLSLKVVAEGVETETQYAFLRNLKCHYVQGYYFSPPLSLDEFREYCRGNLGSGS